MQIDAINPTKKVSQRFCLYFLCKTLKMSDYLPQELLIDILARLPAETLVRLTSVCKSWHSLITGPKFISHHLHRNANDRLLLVRHRTDEPKRDHYSLVLDGNDSFHHCQDLDLPFDSVGYSIVGSCNGVICLSDDYLNDMYLWNPSIRKFVALPAYNVTFDSHGPHRHCLGFGFDPVTNDFKVVRIVHTGVGCDRIPPLVEIYTHKTGRWQYISDKALPLMIRERFRQAFLNGAAHWMAFDRATPLTQFRNTILSFNMSEEVFNEILVPDSITHENSPLKGMILVVFKESLCLIQHCEYGSERLFWIMKEYGVSTSWSKLFRIDLQGLTRPLGLRKNGEAIFVTDDGDLVSCNHQSRWITYLGIRGTFGGWYSHWQAFYTDTYTESLELLNKLESPENIVVSGQKKSNTKEEDEEDEKRK